MRRLATSIRHPTPATSSAPKKLGESLSPRQSSSWLASRTIRHQFRRTQSEKEAAALLALAVPRRPRWCGAHYETTQKDQRDSNPPQRCDCLVQNEMPKQGNDHVAHRCGRLHVAIISPGQDQHV